MVIKYHISPYVDLLEDMVVKVYEAQNPTAEVYSQVLPQPHNNPVTIVINGMDQVVHIVRLYTASAAKLHEYNVEPTKETSVVFDPIRFKIGDGQATTPAVNSSRFEHPALEGLGDNDYEVFRNNYGYLFPALHRFAVVTPTAGTGGFDLVPGDVFNIDEEFIVQRKGVSTSTVVNDSVVAKWFGGFIDVTADTVYNPVHLRKLIRFAGTCNYTFQLTDAIPIGYAFIFTHMGNPTGVGTINFLNAPLQFGTGTKNSLTIKSLVQGCFVFDGTEWNLVYLCENTAALPPATVAPLPGQIMGVGTVNLGDIPAGDPWWTVTHNLNVPGEHIVLLSIKSNDSSTFFRDNKLCFTWWHSDDAPNKFNFSIQELANENQNVTACWTIIKA